MIPDLPTTALRRRPYAGRPGAAVLGSRGMLPAGLGMAGALTLEIGPDGGRKRVVLGGRVGPEISVGFRAKDGDPELALGTFASIIGSVVTAIGAPPDFRRQLDDLLDELGSTNDQLKKIVDQLRYAQLFITDLQIKADGSSGKYKFKEAAFGFRVEFSELKFGPIWIVGFGVLFTYVVNADGKTGTASLVAGPGRGPQLPVPATRSRRRR
jgi:hypothetical protein